MKAVGGLGGESDHNHIVLEIKGGFQKTSSPFKFNASWIADHGYHELLKSTWVHLVDDERNRAGLVFM